MPSLHDEIVLLLQRLDGAVVVPIESGNAEFLQAVVALEARLRDVVADLSSGRLSDSFAELINQAPLSRGEKSWLHEVRAVRNAVVHNSDVHVGKDFTRQALRRLLEVAAVLDGEDATAGTLMTRDVRAVAPDDSVAAVYDLMLQHGYAQVPVRDSSGRFVGLVTERSLLELLNGKRGVDLATLPVTAAITRRAAPTLPSTATLDDVRDAFQDPVVQAVAVLRGERLVGLITRGDLIRFVV